MKNDWNENFYPDRPQYRPASRVDVSAGTEMGPGLLSMRPLIGKGVPTAAKRVMGDDSVAGLTSPLQKQIKKFPNQAPRIRAAQASKKR